jgi:DNA-binding NarL/FixJ family response regulator
MPNLNGIEAARQIKNHNTNIKIIALSGHHHEAFVTDMFQAGASAYVLKECLIDELLEAIQVVSKNGKYLSKKIIMAVVNNYIQHQSKSNKSQLNFLSEQKRKILQLISQGKSTKQIAQELNTSTKSVETNRRNIMEILHTHNIPELVKIAIANGLTPFEL